MLSRRDFLKQSSLIAGGLCISGFSAKNLFSIQNKPLLKFPWQNGLYIEP